MKNGFKSFAIIIMIALIITLSLFGGYKVITLINPDIKAGFDAYTDPIVEKLHEEPPARDPYVYKGTNKREYSGPSIYQAEGIIYNTDGKILADYQNDEGGYLDLSKNADGSEAVLLFDHKCIYIDADLNTKEIVDDCNHVGMCFDGGYLYYETTNGYMHGLYIYDIKANEAHLVAEASYFKSIILSPDGRTVAFNDYSDFEQIHVKSIDSETKVYNTKVNHSEMMSVSNDGETVFFYSYNEKDICYCLNQGKVEELGDRTRGAYLDRECKQIVFMDKKHRIHYYRVGEKKPVTLYKGEASKIEFGNVAMVPVDRFSYCYIVDTDSFADAMMITDDHNCYAIDGETMETVSMVNGFENAYGFSTYVTNEGPTCLFYSRGSVYKAKYDGNKVDTILCFGSEDYRIDFVANDDHSKIWVCGNKTIYCIQQGSEPVPVVEIGDDVRSTIYDIEWDPIEDKCCYIIDNVLYRVGTDAQSNEEIMTNCRWFSYIYGEKRVIFVSGMNDDKYLIIKDEIVAR